MPPPSELPSALTPPGAEQAEAALIEHYPRLVRIGYLLLPPSPGRGRRVLAAHALAQRSLQAAHRARTPAVPLPRRPGRTAPAAPGYASARHHVLRRALAARRARRLPPLLPAAWGLRLLPHRGGAGELALERELAALAPPARAAFVLRGLDGLTDGEVRRELAAAGVGDPHAALAEADGVRAGHALLESAEFDPCSLQARPPDLARRRRGARAAYAAVAALLVCGALLGMPDGGWGHGALSAPLYARNPAAEAALDPAALRRVPAAYWQRSPRRDFTAWPARGDRTQDGRLLRRALEVWARPGAGVRTSATPGTPAGPPMGAPQLLYAGEVGASAVVLFHDGLRVVRYAEPRNADPARGAALDFARVDGADETSSGALVVARGDDGVRYLTAPWVRAVRVRDLLAPDRAARAVPRSPDGVTGALPDPAGAAGCRSWEAVELAGRGDAALRLVTDLGELAPARLTSGAPGAPHDITARADRESWARTACLLREARSHGVRSVNSWTYARQPLPEGGGTARWLCTRAETWRGTGSRVVTQFQDPSERAPAPGTVAARAEDSPACGARTPRVLAGVLWQSPGGRWYVLAAGSGEFASLSAASGGVTDEARGRLLAVPAEEGDRPLLHGRLADGSRVDALH
ncbi:hypothetical protein [Streptomyces sp. NPDC088864]|uniref:hypothetical protein n=1 Tax=Streptomyces sp. NPDC088864 TaxID=3365910 RepID=UPI003815403F